MTLKPEYPDCVFCLSVITWITLEGNTLVLHCHNCSARMEIDLDD